MLRDSRDASTLHNDAIHTLTAASATRALTRLRTTLEALQADQPPLPQTIDAITTSTEDVRHQTHRISSLSHHRWKNQPQRRPAPGEGNSSMRWPRAGSPRRVHLPDRRSASSAAFDVRSGCRKPGPEGRRWTGQIKG